MALMREAFVKKLFIVRCSGMHTQGPNGRTSYMVVSVVLFISLTIKFRLSFTHSQVQSQ